MVAFSSVGWGGQRTKEISEENKEKESHFENDV